MVATLPAKEWRQGQRIAPNRRPRLRPCEKRMRIVERYDFAADMWEWYAVTRKKEHGECQTPSVWPTMPRERVYLGRAGPLPVHAPCETIAAIASLLLEPHQFHR